MSSGGTGANIGTSGVREGFTLGGQPTNTKPHSPKTSTLEFLGSHGWPEQHREFQARPCFHEVLVTKKFSEPMMYRETLHGWLRKFSLRYPNYYGWILLWTMPIHGLGFKVIHCGALSIPQMATGDHVRWIRRRG